MVDRMVGVDMSLAQAEALVEWIEEAERKPPATIRVAGAGDRIYAGVLGGEGVEIQPDGTTAELDE